MGEVKQYTSFLLDDRLFGVDIFQVREISHQLNLTPVPLAPGYLRGLVNLRGQIVTVIDLRQRLGMETKAIQPESCNVILKTDVELATLRIREGTDDLYGQPDKVGLLVDAIGDVITVDSKVIAPPPANIGEIDGKYLLGVAPLEEALMAILDIRKVLEP